jgi:hypothetical protein
MMALSLRFLDVAIAAGAPVTLAVVCALAQTLPSPLLKQGEVTQFSNNFGAVCNSNGTTGNGNDDTAALQAAVNYAQTNGVTFHFVGMPTGRFCRTTSPLLVTSAIEWIGDGAGTSLYTLANPSVVPGAGSWLYADHTGYAINMAGVASSPQPAISLAHISNLGIIRNQTPYVSTGSWTAAALAFDIESSYADTRLDNITLFNGTNGIQVAQLGNGYGRLTIDGIRGEPYNVGIEIDQAYDMSRVANVHLWPYSDLGVYNPVNTYRLSNGIGLKIERADGLDLSNYFSIFENQCIGFYQSTGGLSAFGTSLREQWDNVYCDVGYEGIHIDSSISAAGTISVQAGNVVLFGNSTSALGPLGLNGYNNYTTSGTFVRFDFSNLEVSNYQQGLVYAPHGTNDHMSIGRLRTEGRNLSAGSYAGFNDAGYVNIGTQPLDTSGATTPMFTPGQTVTVSGVAQPYASLILNGIGPGLTFENTSGTTNQKVSDIGSNGQFRLCNDAYSLCNIWLSIARSGYVMSLITLGDSSWTAQLELNSTGLFPDMAGGLTLGTAADPWGTTYTANVQTSGYAIASLPTCNRSSQGMQTFVTNGQTTPTYLGTVSTTGSVIAPVFCNGSNWVYH